MTSPGSCEPTCSPQDCILCVGGSRLGIGRVGSNHRRAEPHAQRDGFGDGPRPYGTIERSDKRADQLNEAMLTIERILPVARKSPIELQSVSGGGGSYTSCAAKLVKLSKIFLRRLLSPARWIESIRAARDYKSRKAPCQGWQARRGARDSRRDLQLVHRGLRYRRP